MNFDGKYLMKYAPILAALALGFALTACGDSSTGNNDTEKISVVDDISELPDCTEDYEGEQVFVIEEEAKRICAGGKWYALKDSTNRSDSTEIKKDSTDKDSTKTDSTDVEKPDVPKDSVELDSEKVATSLDSLVGVSQKGPFITGSDVYLYELESGRTLKQTNGNFTSNIVNDKGRYHFAARDLVSQYAMIVVDGNYRNEVTGKVSDNKIRLKAITDLTKRTSANVNILSHLEYDRVYYLVTKEKKKVFAAKRQAQEEILNQFYINSKNFESSEDLDVFGSTDADAALLAVSILLQGTRSEADLTALLAMIATDIADDGHWSNDSIKTYIADWIFEKDSLNQLQTFRTNVQDWGLSKTVPNFEKYVRNYWYYSYGLKECATKGKVDKNSNEKSKRKSHYFICKDDKWQVAKDIEQDIYQWADGKDGETKPGNVNKDIIYVFDSDHWRPANNEEAKLGGCVIAGKVDHIENDYYICREREWVAATNIEKDTYQWANGNDGDIKPGDVNKDIIYVFDSDHWRVANNLEASFGGCVEAGKVDHIENDYYICREREWVKASDIEKDTYQWTNGNDGDIKPGDVNKSFIYVFDSNHWRRANDQEAAFGGCIASRSGDVRNIGSQYYICRNRSWETATNFEKDTYQWEAGADGEIKTGNVTTQVYVYDSDHWREADAVEAVLGGCVASKVGIVAKANGIYYICKDNRTWATSSDIETDTYGWGTSYTQGTVRNGQVNNNIVYVFENGKWRLGNDLDSLMQRAGGTGCVTENSRSVRYTDKFYYICTKQTSGSIPHIWKKTSEFYSDTADYQSKCNASGPYSKGQIFKGYVTKTNYVCDNGSFRTVRNNESKFKQGCVSYIKNQFFTVDSANGYMSAYKCDYNNKRWVFDIDKNKGRIKDSRDVNYAGEYTYYNTIVIGKQVWMSEDLKYGTYAINGNFSYWSDRNSTLYLRAVVDTVCPSGWQVASESDWYTLFDYAGETNLLANDGSYGWSGYSNPYGFSLYKNRVYFQEGGTFSHDDEASYWLRGEDVIFHIGENIVWRKDSEPASQHIFGAVRCIKK